MYLEVFVWTLASAAVGCVNFYDTGPPRSADDTAESTVKTPAPRPELSAEIQELKAVVSQLRYKITQQEAITSRVASTGKRLEQTVLRQRTKIAALSKSLTNLQEERDRDREELRTLRKQMGMARVKNTSGPREGDSNLKDSPQEFPSASNATSRFVPGAEKPNASALGSSRDIGLEKRDAVVTKWRRGLTSRADDPSLEAAVGSMAQQLAAMNADIQALKNAPQSTPASTSYIRWGHSGCPGSSELVYSGVVGGSSYGYAGAAANYLCMTLDPVNSHIGAPGSQVNYVYGAEYETQDSDQNKNPECAVCRSSLSTTIMIPGTTQCTSGWTKQYGGYLMAGKYDDNSATEFICVDVAMESINASDSDSDGKLLYYVATWCSSGGLPCGPYEHNVKAYCVVCSK